MIETANDRTGRALYLWHLLNLSSEDRMLRFAGQMDADVIVKYVRNLPDTDHLFAYRHGTELVGFAHIGNLADGRAEIGFSVDSEHRYRNIGYKLFKYCVDFCKIRGIDTVYTFCLPTNDAVRRIVSRAGLQLNDHDPGEAVALGQHPDIMAYYNVLGNQYWRNVYDVNRHFMRSLNFS